MKKEKPPLEIKMLIICEIIYGLSVWGIAFYFRLLNPNFEFWQIAIIFWPIVPYCLTYFIWIGERRVWKLALIISIVLIPGSAGWCLLRNSWTGLVDIICNIPIILLLTRPKVKDFFERRS